MGILRTPRTFADIARVGPIAQQGNAIAATIADHDFTGVLAVCTAEEMPVNETLMLGDALARDGLELGAVIVNGLYPERFDQRDLRVLSTAAKATDSHLARGALKAAISEQARAVTQGHQRARLQEGLDAPLVDLPYVFAEELGRGELEQLADCLEAALPSGDGQAAPR
jgi:anion-transporting  ArsA/GET3 family ATPase